MSLDPILDDLARRYGLPAEFALRLLPLVGRARVAPADVRRRILELVESSFAREARRLAEIRLRREGEEDQALVRVARMLHGWRPPAWFEGWGKGA
ncbi:MAG: hypothetical protein GC161_02900 [Planctomycetaceae bacterium]|nr:hypothetical protein [Planctomycetaceae bacterium]